MAVAGEVIAVLISQYPSKTSTVTVRKYLPEVLSPTGQSSLNKYTETKSHRFVSVQRGMYFLPLKVWEKLRVLLMFYERTSEFLTMHYSNVWFSETPRSRI